MSKYKRGSISKRLRFDVFKRDGFKCAYCGQAPPAVILEIDHMEPVSKGGKSDINNYITACFDCNRGKSDKYLSLIPKKVSENLKILKEKETQIKEYNKFITSIRARENRQIKKIEKIFQETYPEREFSKKFKVSSLKYFLNNIPIKTIENAILIATDKIDYAFYDSIKYFCGICHNTIRQNKEGL